MTKPCFSLRSSFLNGLDIVKQFEKTGHFRIERERSERDQWEHWGKGGGKGIKMGAGGRVDITPFFHL